VSCDVSQVSLAVTHPSHPGFLGLPSVQTDTINRLLRAQSGRTKAKIPSSLLPSRPGSGAASTSGDSGAVGDGPPPPPPTLLRFVSSVKGGEFRLTVSFPENKLDAVKMGPVHSLDDQDNGSTRRNVAGTCDVPGCGQRRIYRCVTAFDKGGCSLPHLKLVQGSLSGAANSKSEGIASS
jgi:Ino eighty subunit 2